MNASANHPRRFFVFLLLLGFWLAISGHYAALMVSLGAASAALVTALSSRMGVIGAGQHRPGFYLRLPFYAVWLLWRIVAANCDVARRILNPKLPISPRFIDIEAVRDDGLLRVVQANSITLTPGTISADFRGDTIRVHALTEEAAERSRKGEFAKQVSRLG